MSKFHINKHGVPAPCKAKAGNCPLGGMDTHYDTQEEAQAAVDLINEEKHGILPGVKNADNLKIDKQELKGVIEKNTSKEKSSYRNELALRQLVVPIEIDEVSGEVTSLDSPSYSTRFEEDKNIEIVSRTEDGNYVAHVRQNAKDLYDKKEVMGGFTMKDKPIDTDIATDNITKVIEKEAAGAIEGRKQYERMLETAKLEQADLKEKGVTKVSELVDNFETDKGLRRTDPSILKGELKEEFKYYSDKGLEDHIKTMYNPNTGYSLGSFSRNNGNIRVTVNYNRD